MSVFRNAPRGAGRPEATVALLVSVLAVLVIAWPWVRQARDSIPTPSTTESRLTEWGSEVADADAMLVVWIIGWGAQALWAEPWNVLEANVFHPVPGALRGSEALLSYGAMASPVIWATGNPVLAANVVALFAYVLSGWLFYLLARRLSAGVGASSVAAVAFAFGPMQLPVDVHGLQHANFVLPLVSLAFLARDHRGAKVFLACVFGLFASFYIAAMVLSLMAIELMLTACTRGLREAMGLVLPSLLAVTAFGVLAFSYLLYEGTAEGGRFSPLVGLLVQKGLAANLGGVVGWLALVALVGPAITRHRPSAVWWRWVVVGAVGITVACGPVLKWGTWTLPLPLSLADGSPLTSLRGYNRFLALGHMGLVGLACLAMDGLLRWISSLPSRSAGPLAQAIVVLVLLYAVGAAPAEAIQGTTMERVAIGAAQPQILDRMAEMEPGPVLNIPGPGDKLNFRREKLQALFMLQSLRHGFATLNGHMRSLPAWHSNIVREIRHLPEGDAIGALVEMTGLRWIVVHGEFLSDREYKRWRRFSLRSPLVYLVAQSERHLLLGVRPRQRQGWDRALRDGRKDPGQTVFGTDLRPLPVQASVASVSLRTPSPTTKKARAGASMALGVTVRNLGSQSWPSLVRRDQGDRNLVGLRATWLRPDHGPIGSGRWSRLPRDVAPGDRVHARLVLDAPDEPGHYRVEIRPVQRGGSSFPTTEALLVDVVVVGELDGGSSAPP